ncbi:MAG TPA: hypothetical protein VF653_12405, partial [Methylomirabilota bacterium]
MTAAGWRARPGRRLGRLMGLALLLLPVPAAAQAPAASEENTWVRRESENLQAIQQRALRDNGRRLMEIQAREAGIDQARRAEKITRDRVLAADAALNGIGVPGSAAAKGETWGQTLTRMAEIADRDAGTLGALYRAQGEYVETATAEWVDGPERAKRQDTAAQLQKSLEAVQSMFVQGAEAAQAVTARLPQSRVLDKVAQVETAAR